jgi:hypothetical protein
LGLFFHGRDSPATIVAMAVGRLLEDVDAPRVVTALGDV